MASAASQQFAGSMDSYALSMYEHTRSLMAAAHIPYGSPASLLLATSPGSPGAPAVAGTSSGGAGKGLGLKPGNGSLPRFADESCPTTSITPRPVAANRNLQRDRNNKSAGCLETASYATLLSA
ncbi:hypothetical protein CSHISOI_11595 [Colletotrichum shisoi]|uniref:Uncharacterized protein n=1 Tax=Colletotrichum shisoi TaxID=2078593 RepID=A0A5Q4BB96_9PEZI|nr:hypothetical protein CSHISOI_11595 [Colletotrichum shisoi]